MPRSRLYYHFVWTTKHRQPIITERNRAAIHACVLAKAAEVDGIVHAINSVADHVHLLVTLPPTVSLAEFVGKAKGASSHLASRLSSDLTPFGWQREYVVTTISEQHLDTIARYVECQAQHHGNRSLMAELEPPEAPIPFLRVL